MEHKELTDFQDTVLREIVHEPLRVDMYGEFQSKARLRNRFRGHEDKLEPALSRLLELEYIHEIEERLATGAHWSGYALMPLGRSYLAKGIPAITNNFSNIQDSNIANFSPGSKLNINLAALDDDLKAKLKELEEAVNKKDGSSIRKIFGYIADKSVDVAIALLTQGVKL